MPTFALFDNRLSSLLILDGRQGRFKLDLNCPSRVALKGIFASSINNPEDVGSFWETYGLKF